MKSPAEIRMMLRRQCENAARREARLLGGKEAWPRLVLIGRPSAKKLNADLDSVKRHIATWRQVRVGKVMWESVRYRVGSGRNTGAMVSARLDCTTQYAMNGTTAITTSAAFKLNWNRRFMASAAHILTSLLRAKHGRVARRGHATDSTFAPRHRRQ